MKEPDKIVAEISKTLGVRLGFHEETAAEKSEAYAAGSKSDGKYTYFRFLFGEKTYTGVLDGASKTEKNYAAMLPAYISTFGGKNSFLTREEYLKKMLLGDCSAADAYKYSVKFCVEETPCFVLAIKFAKSYPDAQAILSQYGDEKTDVVAAFDDKNFALVKAAASAQEYSSPVDYAKFLSRFVAEELGAAPCVGVGSVTSGFNDLPVSYTRAVTALRYAEVFSGGEGVHSYKEYMLVKMLEEVPKSHLAEFMDDVTEEEIREVFDDEEMLQTAEKFLSSSLNVSETSRNLYMHRNTLLYRLDKIEKATGLNIRLFPDAVTFRILTVLYKLLKK
ncbi:MAG: helix-turn-helix domain-containing protein [Candidatus Borkfalkiaceae bacterium]|nr:helix-turn-helix domain-containing protein [Clostridia bacterium]MDY6222813.1 helix-turn-helix domain-containing protein [Christensenellaceae bacterium]